MLTGFVPEAWVRALDLRSLETVKASFITDDFREREDDVIWRVRWADGWLYVYILIEFQSTIDAFMAVRIANYVTLLYQDLIGQQALTATGKLPPVLPIVLYNGEPRWTAETDLYALVETVPFAKSVKPIAPRLRLHNDHIQSGINDVQEAQLAYSGSQSSPSTCSEDQGQPSGKLDNPVS